MKKRVLSLLLVLAMMLGMFPNVALADGTQEKPFLFVKVGDTTLNDAAIAYKGQYTLSGEGSDYYSGTEYIVPYYHITVPGNAETAEVYFAADADLFYYESNGSLFGCGYKVGMGQQDDPPVDATSSATVKNSTVRDIIRVEEDGKKVLTLPIAQYVTEGTLYYGYTPENSIFEAVCLFTFEYKEENVAVEIPDGAPFTEITTDSGAVTAITQMDDASTSYYGKVPYYHVEIPADATKVYVTHPTEENPFCDAGYNSAYGYVADTEYWGTSSISFAFETVAGGYKIELPLSGMVDTDFDWMPDTEVSFVADEEGVVSYAVAVERTEDSGFTPICFFTFAYAEAEAEEHVHSYDKGEVTTEPGCETTGIKTYTCSGCEEDTEGHTKTETIPATGHEWDSGEQTKDPTCKDKGEKTYTCQNDSSHTKIEEIPTTGEHTWGEGEQTKAPTCKDKGEMTYTCTVDGCTGKKTEDIDKTTEHTNENGFCTVCSLMDDDYTGKPAQTDGVYQIGTADQLLWFARAVSNGYTTVQGALTANITVGSDWPGIGTSSKKFAGSFDGQNHTVTFNSATKPLFNYTSGASNTNRAVIANVNTAGSVTAAAAIVGMAGDTQKNGYTTIQNCANYATVSGKAGIVGEARKNVTIEQCANFGNITGSASTKYNYGIGGIAGYAQNSVVIQNCYNLGTINNTAGDELEGGIVGNLYNSASVINCYNAGEAAYAIAGNIYSSNAVITNSYYRIDKCTYAIPTKYSGNNQTIGTDQYGVTAKTLVELLSSEFVAELNSSAFKSNECCGPVLSWQDTYGHVVEAGICTTCGMGQTQTFTVTFPSNPVGYTVAGANEVVQGETYSFTVTIEEGYEKTDSFVVKVNGTAVTVGEDGVTYTLTDVQAAPVITVEGVREEPETCNVIWNDVGNGYRIIGSETAPYKGDYTFKVEFVEGFQDGENFAVEVNGEELLANNGTYTYSNVLTDLTITVFGVEAKPYADTVTIEMTATKGKDTFYVTPNTRNILAMKTLEVPYFDLALYGLAKYYYNPNCYVDENGNVNENGKQIPGTRETAYGNITAMHALIYVTEILYLGYDAKDAGKGQSYVEGTFDDIIRWSQEAGSSFVSFWDFGENLNYYVNYAYPLAYEGWGSTSDQVLLHDGDVFTMHMITGSASGSMFPFFVVDDEDCLFTDEDQLDSAVVKQGETVDLTLFRAVPGENYSTTYEILSNQAIYWIEDYNLDYDVNGTNASDEDEGEYDGWYQVWVDDQPIATDDDGKIVIDTADLEPGTYYFAAIGGETKGTGIPGSYNTNGMESGPALFKLTVLEDADRSAAKAVENKITAIGTVTLDDAEAIAKAREAYEALSDDQKQLVGNLEVLTEAENTLKALQEAAALEAAKENAKEEIANYKDAEEYREDQQAELAAAIEAANAAIDAAETIDAVDAAVSEAMEKMDAIKTAAELDAEEAAAELAAAKKTAKEEIAGYKDAEDYREAQQAELEAVIEAANAAIDAAETVEAVTAAVNAAKTAMDAIKTDAELDREEGSKPSIPSRPSKPHTPSLKPSVTPEAPKMTFTDVTEADWFYDSVKQAYENGLIDGMSADTFDPNGKLTIAQAIKLAAALHQLEKNGKVTLKNGEKEWYSTYVAYAVRNGIIDEAYANMTPAQMNAPATRSEFVAIFHGAKDVYAKKNNVADNAIPDVKMTDKNAEAIYEFYRAGILTGSDAAGTFLPNSDIKRCEVAAILIRMFDVDAKQTIHLQ